MAEVTTSVAEIEARNEAAPRMNTVVTQENMNEWVNEQMGRKPAVETGGNGEDTLPGAAAADAPAKVEEPKEGDTQGAKVFFRGKWVPKHDFDYRLHVKTEEKTKAEQDARQDAETKLKAERTRADNATREATELRAKYEPPKPDELGPEPRVEQFANPAEWGKALKEWQADATRREEGAKVRQAERTATWNKAMEAARKEIADFDAVINEGAAILLSKPVTEAVTDTDAGPRILHHLAKNPDVADALNKMPVGRMLREIGKLEASFAKGAEKPPAVELPAKPAATVAEVSRAPAPITPIRGAAAGVVTLKGSDDVPSNWTFEDWKAAYVAGKIK